MRTALHVKEVRELPQIYRHWVGCSGFWLEMAPFFRLQTLPGSLIKRLLVCWPRKPQRRWRDREISQPSKQPLTLINVPRTAKIYPREGRKPNQIFIFSYQYFLNQYSENRIASSLRDQRIENGKNGNVSSPRGPEIASSEGNGNVSDLKSERGVKDRTALWCWLLMAWFDSRHIWKWICNRFVEYKIASYSSQTVSHASGS